LDYETEEQQVEALKKWWAENGRSVILGIAIGAVGIGGWQWWGYQQVASAQEASDRYTSTLETLNEDGADVAAAAATMRAEHGDTLYASMASLAAARNFVEQNDLPAAAEQLQWVVDNTEQPDVQVIAKVRLARVRGVLDDADAGLAMLPTSFPQTFTAIVEEVRGDLFFAKGDVDKARVAYQAALDSGQRSANSNALNMKLDDLADPAGGAS